MSPRSARAGRRARRRSRALPAAACAVALAAAGLAPAAAAPEPRLRVVAHDLSNPRKLVVGPDGALYTVEAGAGANTGGKRCVTSCVGRTGSVVRIAGDGAKRVVSGLGSLAVPGGQDAQGPAAVLVRGGTYYVLMQDMEIDARGVNRVGLPNAGELIATSAGKVKPRVVANLAAFEAAHDPDHGAGPGPKLGQPPVDSDPYAFVSYRGGFAVVDAAGNDLLWVTPSGRISVLAVFPVQAERLTAAQARQVHRPVGRPLPVQSVPTSVAVGPDGALYVGELTGWPYRPGSARVWRVVPGHRPVVYASGFTTISDLAFDGKDLLVLELTRRGLLDPTSPGALIRVRPGGARTLVASAGLAYPTGLAIGKGSIYISNDGEAPGFGSGRHGEIVSLSYRTAK